MLNYLIIFESGWPVEVSEHSGWSGLVSTSWFLKTATQKPEDKSPNRNLPLDMKFNGESKVLYWADVASEIAFVVPTEWNLHSEIDGCCVSSNPTDQSANVWSRSTDMNATPGDASKNAPQRSRNMSLELDKSKDPVPPTRRKANAMKPSLLAQPPAKIYLVWLESFEDLLNFPIGEKSGLFITQLLLVTQNTFRGFITLHKNWRRSEYFANSSRL